jgi:hypothetical protein
MPMEIIEADGEANILARASDSSQRRRGGIYYIFQVPGQESVEKFNDPGQLDRPVSEIKRIGVRRFDI